MVSAEIRGAEEVMIYSYGGLVPTIKSSVFVADGARIIGDVHIDEESSVWFNSVIRGDVNYVRIGSRTNIQDGSILHVTTEKYPLIIGSNVTIGHGVILHGAVVADNCLIGMGAKILDNGKIGEYSLVAAGSVLLEGFEVPAGKLVAGVPGKVKRDLTEIEIEGIRNSAQSYVDLSRSYFSTDRHVVNSEV